MLLPFALSPVLKMEAARYSETSVRIHRTARHSVAEDSKLHRQHSENLKSQETGEAGVSWTNLTQDRDQRHSNEP
jgi:hypothetical protein